MAACCLICERIREITNSTNSYFVKELESGYVVLGDHQFYKGYTLFLSKKHVTELHELENCERDLYLKEMAMVAEAVFKAFNPDKLNYELLGNTDGHLHWHIFPRRSIDPQPHTAVWVVDKSIRLAEDTRLPVKELDVLKKQLLAQLNMLTD